MVSMYHGCVSWPTYRGYGSWLCILAMYHDYVSWLCIMAMYHGHIMAMYHGYVSRLCITAMYHGYVSRLCIMAMYHGYVSWLCIMAMYLGYVSWLCIMAMYFEPESRPAGAFWANNLISRESKVACNFSKKKSQSALNHVLILQSARSRRELSIPLKNIDLQNDCNILVARQWKIIISVPMSYIRLFENLT